MNGQVVVLLHGFLAPGGEMLFLKHRLESAHGLDCRVYSYPSVRGVLDDNASALAEFVTDLGASTVHLLGHSLGGVVALRMLAQSKAAPPGRVVCLGSPLCGSHAAEQLNKHRWSKAIMGDTLPKAALEEPASSWAAELVRRREIGVIAGNVSAGLGRLITSFGEDNDGTVAVAETRLPGLKDHIVMRVSHTGMVVSRNVADQAAAFIERGEFLREE